MAPQQSLGDARMTPAPNLSAGQRELVLKIQQTSKVYAFGFVLGIPLTFGGAHYGITEKPIGFAGTALGLVGLVVGVLALLKARGLKEQLRRLTPDAWRSPAAHLPSARKAATQAAYVNGVLVLLSLGAAGYLLVKGADWGAYGNSFGFGGLMLAVFMPLGMGIAAATTIPQLLQVVPAGARVGQSLYSIIMALGALILFNGIKGFDPLPIAVGGTVTAICLGAMSILGKATKRMRGESS
jgi:MFS family permease